MPIDKKIKDAFNDPSLENEDWLFPPDSVFEKIEDEIYPEKKKRRFFYWWITPFAGILLAALYFGFSYNFNDSTTTNDNKMVSDNQKQKENSQQANESFSKVQEGEGNVEEFKNRDLNSSKNEEIKGVENAGLAINDLDSDQNIIDKKDGNKAQRKIFDKADKSLNNVDTDFNNEKSFTNTISTKTIKTIETVESKNNENSITSNEIDDLSNDVRAGEFPENVSEDDNTNLGIEVEKNFERDLLDTKINESKNRGLVNLDAESEQNITEKKEQIAAENLIKNNIIVQSQNDLGIAKNVDLERLNPLAISSIVPDESKHSISPVKTMTDLDFAINKNKKWLFSAGASYNFWNFKLNDSYQSALTSADFTHSIGKGFAIYTGLERQLRSGFRLKSQVSFERIKFESGHNSPIVYDRISENEDKTNEFDLPMASPLGSLSSNISVGRTEDTTADTISLIVDLNNSHVVTNVDFGLSILKDVYQYKSFKVSFEGGLGVNHLISLKNDLYAFSVYESGYSSGSAAITEDQNELNKTRPYYLLGAAFVCSPRRKNELSLSYQFKQDFNAIYKSGDFSTMLNRHVVSLRFAFAFE